MYYIIAHKSGISRDYDNNLCGTRSWITREVSSVVMALSIEEIEEYMGPQKDDLDSECKERIMLDVSKKISNWKEIAPRLHMQKSDIEAIDREQMTEDQKRNALLTRWYQKRAFKATYKELVTAFLDEGRADLARFLCDCVKRDAESGIFYSRVFGSYMTCVYHIKMMCIIVMLQYHKYAKRTLTMLSLKLKHLLALIYSDASFSSSSPCALEYS